MFEERKTFTIHLGENPPVMKFCKNIYYLVKYFTNEKCKLNVVWNTRKVQSLFALKDKVNPYSCVIYRGDSSCDQSYTGESVGYAKTRCNEHEDKK